MQQLLKRLDEVGFERTRRAVAALPLSLFVLLYLLLAFQVDGFKAAFLALSLCYGVAFVGVVSEWFWGRWFASGLGWSGVMVGIASLVMIGWSPPLAVYGGLHLAIVLSLMGKKMAERYDLQEAWRTRYGMDDLGVARLRKTVTRAAASLPSVILWAFGPKDPGQGSLLLAGAGIAAALLAVGGLRGVLHNRSWGLLAMAGAVATMLVTGGATVLWGVPGTPLGLGVAAQLPAILLTSALVPFALPVARFLRSSRR